MNYNMLIYPVIMPISNCVNILDRKHKYYYTRVIARKSLIISSEKSGLSLKNICKDAFGVPMKDKNIHWSISHKLKYAGGVASITPVGIDIEEILSRSYFFLYSRIANSYEWNLSKDSNKILFLRYWTAKEAVLKAESIGLVGLSRCFVSKIIDRTKMIVNYGLNSWYVEHFYFASHVAAIATEAKNIRKIKIKWFLFRKNDI